MSEVLSDSEWEKLKGPLWKKVWPRLQEEMRRMKEVEESVGFETVLALWIDLQQAMLTRPTHGHAGKKCVPWNCVDEQVNKAWRKLTDPEHALALECLFFQLPEGPQRELAAEVLKTARNGQDRRAFKGVLPESWSRICSDVQ